MANKLGDQMEQDVMKGIEDRARELIATTLNVEAHFDRKAHFSNDLGADSLDNVELVMALEEKFGVSIEDKEAERIQNLDDLMTFLKEKMGPKEDTPGA